MEDTEIELFGPPVADCFGFHWWCGDAAAAVVVVIRARHVVCLIDFVSFVSLLAALRCAVFIIEEQFMRRQQLMMIAMSSKGAPGWSWISSLEQGTTDHKILMSSW